MGVSHVRATIGEELPFFLQRVPVIIDWQQLTLHSQERRDRKPEEHHQ